LRANDLHFCIVEEYEFSNCEQRCIRVDRCPDCRIETTRLCNVALSAIIVNHSTCFVKGIDVSED
jgi:hypothetical protein